MAAQNVKQARRCRELGGAGSVAGWAGVEGGRAMARLPVSIINVLFVSKGRGVNKLIFE